MHITRGRTLKTLQRMKKAKERLLSYEIYTKCQHRQIQRRKSRLVVTGGRREGQSGDCQGVWGFCGAQETVYNSQRSGLQLCEYSRIPELHSSKGDFDGM